MVTTQSEMISQVDLDSSLPDDDQQPKNNPFSSLGRQSSIYSLTLDEFQHTLCESGKNFGSMNMDEFLASIWTAEENQAVNSTATTTTTNNAVNNISSHQLSLIDAHTEKGITKQPSLPRQGSLTLPAPLCRKTVEEVWSEIHKGQQGKHQNNNSSNDNGDNAHNPESAARQPTFGEMTLEDFLVKAGVVRDPACALLVSQPQITLQPYEGYQNNNPTEGPSFVNRPIVRLGGGAAACISAGGGGTGGASAGASVPAYQTILPQGGGAIGESSGYAGNGKRSGGYPPPPPVYYGGRVVNGGGGYGAPSAMVVAPVSPVSSDGLCAAPVDNSGNQFGLDMAGGLRGRKRIIDGPVEKVVERRHRRMIKNRESAARSRARKQAYTVELEAELNQLREENAHLKQALAEIDRKRKQQYFEEMKTKVQTKAQKDKERLRVLRRNLSCQL